MSQRSLAAAALAVWVTGCPSMSTLQSAKTLDEGQIEAGFALGPIGYVPNDSSGISSLIGLPMGEVLFRYGVFENLDVGAKYTFPVTGVFDVKYRFLGGPQPGVNAAFDLGFSYWGLGWSYDGAGQSINSFVFYPTLILSVDGKRVSLYVAPKGLYSIFLTSGGSGSSSSSAFSPGFSVGARLGQTFGVNPELSMFFSPSDASGAFFAQGIIYQLALGFMVRL